MERWITTTGRTDAMPHADMADRWSRTGWNGWTVPPLEPQPIFLGETAENSHNQCMKRGEKSLAITRSGCVLNRGKCLVVVFVGPLLFTDAADAARGQ